MSVAVIDVHEGWLTPGKRTAAGGDEALATARDDTAFASALASLTKRQRQIVHLRARGLTIAEICDYCFLSENTVKNHLHGAFRTLGLGGLRHQARLGRLLSPGPVRGDARGRVGKTSRTSEVVSWQKPSAVR